MGVSDTELRHRRTVVEAAHAAGVGRLVYVSGDGAASDSPVPLLRVKFAVEERIRELGIRHTILAPVYLMENLFNPWNLPALRAGIYPSPIALDAPLAQAATADVVAFAAHAIEHPLPSPALFHWLEDEGHSVDPADLHRRYPHIAWQSYAEWAATQRGMREPSQYVR